MAFIYSSPPSPARRSKRTPATCCAWLSGPSDLVLNVQASSASRERAADKAAGYRLLRIPDQLSLIMQQGSNRCPGIPVEFGQDVVDFLL
ncbi:hypothetical protein [Bosea vaviloviae]|uniref:hypothetical protein n=1 Tax=Bosea vaviloviae TaxID=1526658 RepID=UPI00131477F9|nr:hypothetical protein [Bosea vaviloviae]